MNVKNIIPQGEDAKYNIRIEREGFSMQDNDFRLTLKWGMQEKQLVIQKSQMMDDEAGNWLFIFPTKDMVGVVTAVCEYDVPDGDYADGFRTEKEEQPLCFVNTNMRLPQIMKDDGTMARLDDVFAFAAAHDLKVMSIADLIAYRRKNEK